MHISDTNLCPRCGNQVETALHALRDCFFMEGIWKEVIRPDCWEIFFNKNLKEWVELGLLFTLKGTSLSSLCPPVSLM